MKYNEYNTASLNAVGGKTAGLTMTVATMQLGVCALYAIIMWIVKINPAKLFGLQAPAKQNTPKITGDDVKKTLPVGFCSAAAHACTVFALGGDPLFGQIVKSGEPVLSALVNTVFYGKPPSNAKVACLPVIVGGVAFASLKKSAETGGYALKFDQTALVFGMLANTFAAFKGSENKKLMSDAKIAERYGGVGNQVSVALIRSFLCDGRKFRFMMRKYILTLGFYLHLSSFMYCLVFSSSFLFPVRCYTNPCLFHVLTCYVRNRRRQVWRIFGHFQYIYRSSI